MTPVDFRSGGADFERRNVASPCTSYGRFSPIRWEFALRFMPIEKYSDKGATQWE